LSSVDRGLNGYRARHILAGIYADHGDLAKAESLWRQVIDEVPSFRPAWRGLGDVLVRQGKSDEALRLVEQMEQSKALASDARLLRVDALARLGKTTLARDELNTAIQATPDDTALLECRCRLVFDRFPPSEAEFAFRDLLARDPQNAAAQHNLGSILYKLRRYDESAGAYRESLRVRPNSASTYLHLGYALRESGNLDAATAAWEEALKLAPNDQTVMQALEEARPKSDE
jgi:tetratricopeptide (TPR) repeat protein